MSDALSDPLGATALAPVVRWFIDVQGRVCGRNLRVAHDKYAHLLLITYSIRITVNKNIIHTIAFFMR